MLDSMPPLGKTLRNLKLPEQAVRVQDFMICAVADSVNGHSEPRSCRLFKNLHQRFTVQQQHSAVSRFTFIGLQHGSRSRPQGAIGKNLDVAESNPCVPKAALEPKLAR